MTIDLEYEAELNDVSGFRKVLGVLVASCLTPAMATFSFLFLSEAAALFGLSDYPGDRQLFTLEFFSLTAALMFLGYVFSFILIPVAVLGHLTLNSPYLARRYATAVSMGIAAALIFGLVVFADLVSLELEFEQNVWILMLVIGGAFVGAANLFIYRLVSGDRREN